MPTAFAWARVSSKDQEQAGNSIPGQLRSIREFAQAKGINITQEYSAGESAFQGDRDQFEAMVADALRLRPDFVLGACRANVLG